MFTTMVSARVITANLTLQKGGWVWGYHWVTIISGQFGMVPARDIHILSLARSQALKEGRDQEDESAASIQFVKLYTSATCT